MSMESSLTENIINVEDLSYCYEETSVMVLRDLNFSIRRGEFIAIMGPSGAGKTTLCLALNGIVPCFLGGRFFGKVSILGQDTLDLSVADIAQHAGMVFQDPETQLVANTVEDEIAFGLENVKVPPDEIRRRISEVLKIVRLEGHELKHPNALSGGQKQRLAIAAALALRPQVMILDEPTSQLDPVGAEEVFSIIRALNEEHGMTVVLVTHDSERVAEYADRVLLLHEGQILADRTPDALFQDFELLEKTAVRAPQVTDFYRDLCPKIAPLPSLPIKLEEAKNHLDGVFAGTRFTPTRYGDSSDANLGDVIISTDDLRFTYPDGTEALSGLSLSVREGECLAIIGQNGGGKSTLVKHFLHLLEASGGNVTIFDKDATEYTVSELAHRIGFVYQNPDAQIFSKSVVEEVRFGPANQIKDAGEVDRRVQDALEAMDLADVADVHPLALSKGDRERVAVAAVLALDPEVLIFDEPTTGQDYAGCMRIMNMIRKLHEQGRTIIVITHHLYLLPDYIDRIILVGDGQILLDAPIRHALNQVDLMKETDLPPPQFVEFVQHIGRTTGETLNALSVTEAVSMFSKKDGN